MTRNQKAKRRERGRSAQAWPSQRQAGGFVYASSIVPVLGHARYQGKVRFVHQGTRLDADISLTSWTCCTMSLACTRV